jgi:hypothetical protein
MVTATDRKRLRFRRPERLFWVWLYQPPLAGLPRYARRLQGGHVGALASQRLSAVLDLEVTATRWWSAHDLSGGPRPHSSGLSGKSTVGCPSCARGAADARRRCLPNHRREVHGSASKAAIAELADGPRRSRPGPRLGRFLHRAHGDLSNPPRVPRAQARATPGRALESHRTPDRPMDSAATGGGLSSGMKHPGIFCVTATTPMAPPLAKQCPKPRTVELPDPGEHHRVPSCRRTSSRVPPRRLKRYGRLRLNLSRRGLSPSQDTLILSRRDTERTHWPSIDRATVETSHQCALVGTVLPVDSPRGFPAAPSRRSRIAFTVGTRYCLTAPANLHNFRWQTRCHGLYQLPVAACLGFRQPTGAPTRSLVSIDSLDFFCSSLQTATNGITLQPF